MKRMRNSRLDILFSGYNNVPYARRYRKSARIEPNQDCVAVHNIPEPSEYEVEERSDEQHKIYAEQITHQKSQAIDDLNSADHQSIPPCSPEFQTTRDSVPSEQNLSDLRNDQLSDDANHMDSIYESDHEEAECRSEISDADRSTVCAEYETSSSDETASELEFESNDQVTILNPTLKSRISQSRVFKLCHYLMRRLSVTVHI
nr:uncharacterized protein LOC109418677 [Aedes albopictus]